MAPDEGDGFVIGGGEVLIKAMPEQTRIGGFSVETFPPGFATPEHVHRRDDGVFYILEGAMRIKCGDLDAVAGKGSMVYLPQGVPHAFRVEGDEPVRWFNVQSPHGDFMLRTMGQNAEIDLLGPPPF